MSTSCHLKQGLTPPSSGQPTASRSGALRKRSLRRCLPLMSNVRAHLMPDELFPCPSCGFLVFGEPPGSYEICELCGWEDDHVQLAHPNMRGGANKNSLVEHQQHALQTYPLSVTLVGNHKRSPQWRPLRSSEVQSHSAPTDGCSYFEAAAEAAPHYYWLRDAAL